MKTLKKLKSNSNTGLQGFNSTYPFLTPEDLKREPEYDWPDVNRCRKITAWYDNRPLYDRIVKQYPQQKHFRDRR